MQKCTPQNISKEYDISVFNHHITRTGKFQEKKLMVMESRVSDLEDKMPFLVRETKSTNIIVNNQKIRKLRTGSG